tara:strand:- start:1327 stop:1629 length:303 start_codon:yes stop_codon:yes gene_type:complete
MKTKSIPPTLKYWTADQVAECLSYQKHMTKLESDELYQKLWSFLETATDPTPQGGDGSKGTVEEPASRLNPANDDKAPHWWDLLLTKEQEAISKALINEG